MKTSEVKKNFEILLHMAEMMNSKTPFDNSILKDYSGFGSYPYFNVPHTVNEIIEKPGILEKYSFAKESQIKSFVNFLNSAVKIIGLERVEGLKETISKSNATEFYTPRNIVNIHVNSLLKANIDKLNDSNYYFNILEPCCGTGIYLDCLKEQIDLLHRERILNKDYDSMIGNNLHIAAVESNSISYNIAKSKNPEMFFYLSLYEKMDFKNIKFDLILGNIPFGKNNIYTKDFPDFKPNLHQYFFLKSNSLLKDDGYLSLFTSSAIADNDSNKALRQKLIENNALVNSIRFPSSTFERTQVIADLITFKRTSSLTKEQKIINKLYANSAVLYENENFDNKYRFKINQFYNQNPKSIIGEPLKATMYGSPCLSFNCPKENLEQKFKDNFSGVLDISHESKIPKVQIAKQKERTVRKEAKYEQLTLFDQSASMLEESLTSIDKTVYDKNYINRNKIRTGTLILHDGVPTIFSEKTNSEFYQKIEFPELNQNFVGLYLNLRDSYSKVFSTTNAYDREINHSSLIEAYNNLFALEKLRLVDYNKFLQHDTLYSEISNLEIVEVKDGKKVISVSDILANKDYFKVSEKKEFQNYNDAIIYSLNKYNYINFKFLSNAYKIEEEKLKKIFVENGILFYDPISKDLVTKDLFESGAVFSKFDFFNDLQNQEALNSSELPFWFNKTLLNEHLIVLNESKPRWLSFDEIDIQLGSCWLDKSLFSDFASRLFNQPINLHRFKSEVRWKVEKPFNYESETYREYTIRNSKGRLAAKANKILEYALNNQTPIFTYKKVNKKGQEVTVKDAAAFKKCQNMLERINVRWNNYIASLPFEKKRSIESLYNYKYNNNVPRTYDGAFLTLEYAGSKEARKHQKDSVYQILQQDGCILDQKAGSGKSMIMYMAAMQMKKLGLKKKPVISGMKSKIEELYTEFKTLYPNAKVLFENPKMEGKSKIDYLSKIANNDWDCIFMKHSTLAAIPVPPNIEIDYLNNELLKMRMDFNYLNGDDTVSKREIKGLQTRMENSEVRIKHLEDSLRDKALSCLYNIETIGIDHIFVDESHMFKNIGLNTIHSRVAGLGTRKGSQQAVKLKMLGMALNKILGGDKGLTLASGTVISNTMVEMYNVLSLICPNYLHQKQIYSFDSFAKLFAVKSNDYELSVTGDMQVKERFREFTNVPELIAIYKNFANIVTDDNLAFDKPQLVQKLVCLPPSPEQERFSDILIDFVNSEDPKIIAPYVGKEYSEEQLSAKMLICTNLSKKASIDMRLINSSFSHNNGKIDHVCNKINSLYNKYNEQKGVQIVFSDLGVPNKNNEIFDIYNEIQKTLLLKYGIPKHEIAFSHDATTDRKKEELYALCNQGKIRIVIGSTQKLGTGTNIQSRCCAIHNLDIPWRPSDLEQRNTRGARQGNFLAKEYMSNKITSYIYATEKSLDAYCFEILKNKQNFIDQIKKGSVTERKFSEGEIDDESGAVSFAIFSANLRGDTTILEKMKVEKGIEKLTSTQNYIIDSKAKLVQDIKYFQNAINDRQEQLLKHSSFMDQTPFLRKFFETGDKKNHPTEVVVNGKSLKLKDADKIIYDKYATTSLSILPGERKEIYSLHSFSLILEKSIGTGTSSYESISLFVKDNNSNRIYNKSRNIVPKHETSLTIANVLSNYANSTNYTLNEIERYKNRIEEKESMLKSFVFTPEQEQKLKKLKKQLAEIEVKLKTKEDLGEKSIQKIKMYQSKTNKKPLLN